MLEKKTMLLPMRSTPSALLDADTVSVLGLLPCCRSLALTRLPTCDADAAYALELLPSSLPFIGLPFHCLL